ncbi:MAG: VPLPA-CTERM sorting domain-containing protein, partial [Planctomycetota bacterium]
VIDLSQVIVLDGDNDGIPGNAMTSGPFPGITPAFYGTLTGQYVVPVPAAAWLFGSGLMGLIGIAKRKNTT